tara:strand:- start:1957 stop:3762 length:1806 start_codon:yes stop_codon:yes gene_type:complete
VTAAAVVPAAAAAAGVAAEAATAATATAATAAATTVAATGGSFWGYFFSFLFGGVFFSTALGVATIFISVGSSNVQRAWRVFKFLSSRVWTLVLATIQAVKASLDNKEKDWDDTKAVLAEGLKKTKAEVDESLRAFNEEKDFYAAAVGVPGLRTAQYVIDHMMPGLIAAKLEQSLEKSIANVKHPNVKRMILKSVTAGRAAPLLTGARFYDVGDEDMAFDVDVSWESEIEAGMDVVPAMGLPAEGLARVPVLIHDVKFDGTVRVLMARLSRKDPGYGAVVLSFPEPPVIALDVRVGGGLEVNRVPWLRKAVSDATKSWIKEEMLWPRRMLIPAEAPSSEQKAGAPPVNVLSDSELAAVLTNDPLLRAERNLMSLKELASGELGTKKSSGKAISKNDEGSSRTKTKGSDLSSLDESLMEIDASGSMDDGPIVDVEITDPDHPRPEPPKGPSTSEKIFSWLGGTAKAVGSKTIEVSKATIETSKNVAQSDDTKRVIQNVTSTVKETPTKVSGWWEKDARSWINNVAARATGGQAVDKNGFPTAKMWVEPPGVDRSDKKSTNDTSKNEASGSKKGPSKKNGQSAPGGVDGTTAPIAQEKKKPEM